MNKVDLEQDDISGLDNCPVKTSDKGARDEQVVKYECERLGHDWLAC